MKVIQTLIEQHQEEIERHRLFATLASSEIPAERRLGFLPAILLVVFNFRDLLELFRVDVPRADVDVFINRHCMEDEGHWVWFLNDLERLGMNPRSSLLELCRLLSDRNSRNIRGMFHAGLRHLHACPDPWLKLVMLEVLEAGFTVFIRNVHKPITEIGKFEELDYLGRRHLDAELAHEVGNWDDRSAAHNLARYALSDEVRPHARTMVDDMFRAMGVMFSHWNEMIVTAH